MEEEEETVTRALDPNKRRISLLSNESNRIENETENTPDPLDYERKHTCKSSKNL